jgi:proline iminopeptidase
VEPGLIPPIGDVTAGRYVPVGDTRLWVLEMGAGRPLLALHGGPGLDHVTLRPWLDPLAERVRLVYVDLRSQGRSDLADPATWTLGRMAADLDDLAASLDVGEGFAVLGHAFGAFVALTHAVERGTATHYVLSGGVASSRWLRRLERSLGRLEPPEVRRRVVEAWDRQAEARTAEDVRSIVRDQLPFHLADPTSEAARSFAANVDRMAVSADVLRHFASRGAEEIDVEDRLGNVSSPVLVLAGDHDRVAVPEAAYALAAGVPRGRYVLLEGAGHLSFVEQPEAFRRSVESFLGEA